MEYIPAELFPVEPWNGEGPSELEHEGLLLSQMAVEPIEPSALQAYTRRKYPMYFLIAVAFVGLPLSVGGATFLTELGLPAWIGRAALAAILFSFFVFFFAIIALVSSRTKVIRHMGIKPIEHATEGVASDVSMLAIRHGRNIEYGLNGAGNFWRYGKAAPEFKMENRDGQFYAAPGLPPAIRDFVGRLPRNKLWRNLRIWGGPWGIQTQRPLRLSKYFLQDLWLLEGLLNSMKV